MKFNNLFGFLPNARHLISTLLFIFSTLQPAKLSLSHCFLKLQRNIVKVRPNELFAKFSTTFLFYLLH